MTRDYNERNESDYFVLRDVVADINREAETIEEFGKRKSEEIKDRINGGMERIAREHKWKYNCF